jgi:signal peptidase II
MKTPRRLLLLGTVLALSVGCDQLTKRMASDALQRSPPHTYLHDVFRLQYAENAGAFLSLGANLASGVRASILTGAVGVFLAGLLAFAVFNRKLNGLQVLAYALTLGGGWSNWLDRFARNGRVVDFMNLGIGPVRTGIFNVADLAIVAGIVLLVLLPRPRPAPPTESPVGAHDGPPQL